MLRTLTAFFPALGQRVQGRVLPLAFTVLLVLVALPILAEPLPPLTDYVNHLARMHVMARLDVNPVLADFYEIRWAVIPNLIMDVLVPPLVPYFSVLRSGQIFLLLMVVLLVTGPMAIHRALWGRFSPWPLLAFPLVYNGIFLVGLVNYLLGTGIALWGVAGWIALRDRAPWQRTVLSTAVVLTLFLCHLFAVGLYGMTLLAFEAWRLWRSSDRSRWRADILAFGLPFLPVLPLILASPTLGLSHEMVWESRGKLEGVYLAVELYRDSVDLLFAAVVVGAGIWLARRNALGLHPAGWTLLCLGAVVFLVMPRQLFGSWIADQRLPVALFFLLIGFISPNLPGRLSRRAFYVCLMGLTLARVVEVGVNWSDLAQVSDDMTQAVSNIPRGSKVLVAEADRPNSDPALVQALSHAPLIAVIGRDALVSTIFSVPGKQVLNIRRSHAELVDREDGDPPKVGQLLATTDKSTPGGARFWDFWPQHYDYVFVLYTEPQAANPDPDDLDFVAEGRGFQLYRTMGGE
ncbi:hypothetical protein [Magnetospirillum sp. 64-120]|uniref:hypothetical protein n=1 Tax=Magnetospirillum sp. 64-120 TaxID=1895778 RepID=UPI000928ACD1|nr:hypothetical protein [Magnetospirillum sp. 64-120]OJX75216.1 MAG: hypothetical protein BGO92_00415 [Magnetospirillum sp. 64-120]